MLWLSTLGSAVVIKKTATMKPEQIDFYIGGCVREKLVMELFSKQNRQCKTHNS